MSRPIRMHEWHDASRPGMMGAEEEEEEKQPGIGVRYTCFLSSIRYFVLFLWLLGLAFGVYLGPKFLNHTKDVFDAPPGTPAYEAKQKWNTYYPQQAHVHNIIALAHDMDGKSLLNNSDALAFCQSVDAALNIAFNQSSPAVENAAAYTGVNGYFSTLASVGPLGAATFLGSGDSTMFWSIGFQPDDEDMAETIAKHVRDVIADLNTRPEQVSLGATGSDLLNVAIGEGTASDMIHTDSIILPIAMVVLCCYLKSLRLMIIPILCVGLSLLLSFSIMLPLAVYAFNVASFAPSIMMSLTVAMSIDYNLFMLTRYREEILSGIHSKEIDAIGATVTHSGEVIIASGLTLAITFASLIAFPMDFLSSIGMGAACTILSCLFVNLTFTPAMLLTFPRFFADFRMAKFLHCILPKSYTDDVPSHRFGDKGLDDAFVIENHDGNALEQQLLYGDDGDLTPAASSPSSSKKPRSVGHSLNSDADLSISYSVRPAIGIIGEDGITTEVRQRRDNNPRIATLRARQTNSFWYKSAVFSTTTWISVGLVLAVIGGCVPFIISCTHLGHTIDQSQLLPRGSPAVAVFNEVRDYLSPGLLGQYQILVVLDETKLPPSMVGPYPILSNAYYNFTSQLVDRLLGRGLVSNTSVVSVAYLEGQHVTGDEAQLLLSPGACAVSPIACLYEIAFSRSANDGLNSNCTLVVVTTPFPPLGDEAQPWLADVREVMEEMTQQAQTQLNGAISLYITGEAVSAIDAVNKIYELFPYVVLSTVGVVLFVVGLVFRSLFVPLRLILTLALPLAYTYGLAIMVFQENRFDWLGSVVADTHDIYWLDPVMAFSILVGLGLDYDIFLYSRVQEFRQLGYSNTASIRKGVYKTGAIITGAGIIMAIAFAGLMLSAELVLNIFGFMLCFAVILDTFLIRTLLVPALLHLAGSANWFPTKMPTAVKGDFDQEGEEIMQAEQETTLAYSFR